MHVFSRVEHPVSRRNRKIVGNAGKTVKNLD